MQRHSFPLDPSHGASGGLERCVQRTLPRALLERMPLKHPNMGLRGGSREKWACLGEGWHGSLRLKAGGHRGSQQWQGSSLAQRTTGEARHCRGRGVTAADWLPRKTSWLRAGLGLWVESRWEGEAILECPVAGPHPRWNGAGVRTRPGLGRSPSVFPSRKFLDG